MSRLWPLSLAGGFPPWQQQLLCSTDAKLQCEPHGCIALALAG